MDQPGIPSPNDRWYVCYPISILMGRNLNSFSENLPAMTPTTIQPSLAIEANCGLESSCIPASPGPSSIISTLYPESVDATPLLTPTINTGSISPSPPPSDLSLGPTATTSGTAIDSDTVPARVKATVPVGIHSTGQPPSLLERVFETVRRCDFLLNEERAILLAVLSNMPSRPSDKNASLRRILDLGSDDLKFLATVFRNGLLAARNFGGRPFSSSRATPGSSSTGTNSRAGSVDRVDDASTGSKRSASSIGSSISTTKSPKLFAKRPRLVGVSSAPVTVPTAMSPPPPPTPGPPTESEYSRRVRNIMMVLEIPHIFPALEDGVDNYRWPRRESMATDCLIRQGNICPLTGKNNDDHPLQAAHLVPHAVASVESYADVPYWCLLSFILPPDVLAHLCELAGGPNSSTLTNGIAMDGTMHTQFDKGTIWLLPQVPDDLFCAETTNYYDVEFRWRGSEQGLGGLGSQLPESPDAQVDEAQGTYNVMMAMRPIKIGDRFRLFTVDPIEYPLPHPLLLSLHAVLWEMISAAGLAEPERAKTTRLERYNGPPAPRGRATVRQNFRAGRRGSLNRGSNACGMPADGARTSQSEPSGGAADSQSHQYTNAYSSSYGTTVAAEISPSHHTDYVLGCCTYNDDIRGLYYAEDCDGYDDGYKDTKDLAGMKAAFRDWCIEEWEDLQQRRAKAGYYDFNSEDEEYEWEMQTEEWEMQTEEVGW